MPETISPPIPAPTQTLPQPRAGTWRLAFLVALALSLGGTTALADDESPRPATRFVVMITTDGLRWEEVFRGAEESLINKDDGGVENSETLRRQFWRESTEDRRTALMPFFWKTIARDGQVFGNRDKGSLARVTNGMNFSYPGYNELLTGSADPGINSNDKRPNPNVSVLEWLDHKPAFHGKVAVVGSWDVFPFILNVERSKLPVNAGWMPIDGPSPTRTERMLNDLMSRSIHEWDNCRNDVFTFRVALEHLRHQRPRVLYLSLGDTDEYGHHGRYDLYLRAAHEADAAIQGLWNELQSRPPTRGATSLIVTTDHGRGKPPRDWRSHGAKFEGSDAVWMAVLGPDTKALGERTGCPLVTQSQVAATLATLLGEDYNADVPRAAEPIWDVLPEGARKAARRAPSEAASP
jgi:hypothetical protein